MIYLNNKYSKIGIGHLMQLLEILLVLIFVKNVLITIYELLHGKTYNLD